MLGFLIAASTPGVSAQGLLLSVAPSTDSLLAGTALTYTIGLTNLSGFTLSDLWITNSFSGPVQIGTVTFTIGDGVNYVGSATTGSNTVILDFQQFTPAILSTGSAQATISVVPQAAGFRSSGLLTNAVVAVAPALQTMLNTLTTNVVVQVTNNVLQADLGVAISGLGQGILAGDIVSYEVSVTNQGPHSVSGVFLTNTLPPGTALLSVTPTNHYPALTNGLLVVNLGTLTNGAGPTLRLTVQPTNGGPQIFSASVGAAGLLDTHPADNRTNLTVNIGTGTPVQVIATNASPMRLDPQVGLMEQTVRLTNVGTSSVASVRVTVSGLTNWLYNAIGTNNGNPFVVYPLALNPNQSVDLVLEYFVPARVSIEVRNSDYTVLGIPTDNFAGPPGTNASFSITRTVILPSGSVLIEFPSQPGATYSILYSSDAGFSNSLVAQPSITAPADRVQWLDQGPPKTISAPASTTMRFYRVLKN